MTNKDFIVSPAREAEINFAIVVDPNAKSGNPNHNAFTGQFGSGGKTKAVSGGPQKGQAANTDQLSTQRKYDQIRVAARYLDGMNIEQVKSFLKQASKRELNPQEVNDFYNKVREQVLSDLVTVYDQHKRGNAFGIKVDESWKEARLSSLNEAEKNNIKARLQGLGWTSEELANVFN